MNHSFFAYIFRMRHITRWALMRNTRTENVEEHSCEAAEQTLAALKETGVEELDWLMEKLLPAFSTLRKLRLNPCNPTAFPI